MIIPVSYTHLDVYKRQEYEREYVKSFEKDLMEKLQRENGVTVFRAPDIDKWRAAVRPIYEERADDVGGMELIERILNM